MHGGGGAMDTFGWLPSGTRHVHFPSAVPHLGGRVDPGRTGSSEPAPAGDLLPLFCLWRCHDVMARLEVEVQLHLALQTIPVSTYLPDPRIALSAKQTHNIQCTSRIFDNVDQHLLGTRRSLVHYGSAHNHCHWRRNGGLRLPDGVLLFYQTT
jgi:hypothetical protein